MEQFIRRYDREYLKMAMLKHEETFRQQVHELHRLYRVQKLLMREMESKELKRQRPLHPLLPTESELDLTLAIGSSRKKREGTAFASCDSGASFSSSSTESGGHLGHEWGLVQVPNVNSSFQSERTRAFDAGEGMMQEGLKQQPWLLHCLSLKMT
uniref:Uncharacterized protein n=1 Tax=Ananas comosus var. bracteatus TaxID=296719 RepID=A0A6V7QDV4_ANACO|nr:unnamed protein product [Ananas comosus var. bracteatus]